MKSIFVENNSDNLKKKILNKLEKYNVCVLKNFIQEDKINKIFNILKKRNKNNKDIPDIAFVAAKWDVHILANEVRQRNMPTAPKVARI